MLLPVISSVSRSLCSVGCDTPPSRNLLNLYVRSGGRVHNVSWSLGFSLAKGFVGGLNRYPLTHQWEFQCMTQFRMYEGEFVLHLLSVRSANSTPNSADGHSDHPWSVLCASKRSKRFRQVTGQWKHTDAYPRDLCNFQSNKLVPVLSTSLVHGPPSNVGPCGRSTADCRGELT